MHQELRHMISADKLLDQQEELRYLPTFEAYWNSNKVLEGKDEWMYRTIQSAHKRFEESTPDFEDLINSSLIHKLNKLSEDFKHMSGCFGFDVPNYNNAFLLYKTKLLDLLKKWIRNACAGLPVEQRAMANAICAEMKVRVGLIYGLMPFY